MFLQILVNHFNEDETIVKRFLSSLATQEGVAFEVLICSDGGDLKPDWLQGYSFPITYSIGKHVGVCHTRNVLFDQSTADYVMFCDIDDCFREPNGLKELVAKAIETDGDVIGSPYLVERKTQNGFEYSLVDHDIIRVHGKIFKRSFLIENEIRFPDEMETSGDMMFLWLVYALSKNVVWVAENFYTWKWNPNSVTEHDPFKSAYLMRNTLKCYTLLAENLIRRRNKGLLDNLIATTYGMAYVETTDPTWMLMPEKDRIDAEAAIVEYVRRFLKYYGTIPEHVRRAKYELMREYKKSNPAPFEGLLSWAKSKHASEILIIGHGVVGTNLEKELSALHPDIYDKYKNEDTRSSSHYKLAFICVDTPRNEASVCDPTEVKNAIRDNDADIYVIKSTILPGRTDTLKTVTGKRIVFSPEYYGGTQHCNNFDFDFTILGGERNDCIEVVQVLQKVYDARHSFRITDSKTAELAKYMENSYLATKVSFCCQFADICEQVGVSYEELRELFILDPRVNASHTFVYRDHPYWKSHCLDKDVAAIAEAYNAPFLESVINFNENLKQRQKSDIPDNTC